MEDRLLVKRELARRELARRDYGAYLKLVHGPGWRDTRLSHYLAGEIQRFLEEQTGNAYDILVLACPPQHGKSMTVTESLPSWVNGIHPDWRIIQASYNEETAERFCRRNKEKLKAWGPILFGVGLGAISRADEYELDGGRGGMISRGIMSGITGRPAELLIIDDPIKNMAEAVSETARDRVWEEWNATLKSRLASGAKVILIMTPWHEDDLRGRILRTERNVKYIRLPVEAEENDPLGRKLGEPLCPELGKDAKWLAQFREAYLNDPKGGQRAWSALYRCDPRREEGNLVRRDWWRYYEPGEEPRFGTQVISVDAAFKGGERSDYVAITVWGKSGSCYYLRCCLKRRMDFVGTLAAIRQMKERYPEARTVLIEDKANGSAIINVLQKEMFCVPVNPEGGKVSRVYAVSPAIESGHVFLPKAAAWLGEYVDEWAAFPNGAHDDCVDSSTQALSWLLRCPGVAETGENTEDGRVRLERELFLGDELYNIY
ncbi:MAG: phage terminase large subunit [Oscillospiraceae bacterium]|nr:phage terminase large subunit [Oscillospiraceae bacterium]